MKNRLVIGSRGSKLAMWQAQWVKGKLNELWPQTELSIEVIKTTGDVISYAPLAVIGGKGVFTKEIEEALLAGSIDLAVHSLKDLPTKLPDGLSLSAVCEREDPSDALVIRAGMALPQPSLATLPANAIVGTSSLRRLAQLKHLRPDLKVKELRGNIDTRLRKLDAGDYDAVILASAGLSRLGLNRRISQRVPPEVMLPAVGQGALGVETRENEHEVRAMLAPLEHAPTRAACEAERALLRALGGGCQLPIAAYAEVSNRHLKLSGLVASPAGDSIVRDSVAGRADDAEELGAELAARLLAGGADALLK